MVQNIIYYTHNKLEEPLFSLVQKYITDSGLPIVSASLKPINFGKNIIVDEVGGYPAMVSRIITALENSTADYVFFCEDDVLYHKSHFDFIPPRDDIFYYNSNVWRWKLWDDKAIRYDRMLPLSCLCANRQLVLDHYKMRQRKIEELGPDEFKSREPERSRIWGYEPGTKKKKRGGLTDDDFDTWYSKYPVIDIRHSKTFSSTKVTLDSFKHQPTGWQEIPIEDIPGWNLKELFNGA